jgi:hypothetical protein
MAASPIRVQVQLVHLKFHSKATSKAKLSLSLWFALVVSLVVCGNRARYVGMYVLQVLAEQ